MAIFTMQASKATPKKGIDYILDKKKAADVIGYNLDSGRDIAQQMNETAAMWGQNQKEDDRKYYHFKISFHPDDWNKNGGPMDAIDAARFGMDLLKERFKGHEGVIAAHTDKDHLHVHGIINSVNMETGNKLHLNDREYRKIKDRVQEMCRERGLRDIDWRKATEEKRQQEQQPEAYETLTFAEKGIRERNGMPDQIAKLDADHKSRFSWKDELRYIIDYAAANSRSLKEFNETLKEFGVETPRNTANSISYLHPGQKKAVRGDKLGGAYTKAAIMDAFEYNKTKDLPTKADQEQAKRKLQDLIDKAKQDDQSRSRTQSRKQVRSKNINDDLNR